MDQERRRSERKRVLLEAKWESMSRTHEARIDDVSLGGCFVNTFGRVELRETVNLQIQLPSGEWLPLRGEVSRSLKVTSRIEVSITARSRVQPRTPK